jgi:hypothetical protein
MADPLDAKRVGYRQPPVASRFKSGRSGNPSGRPKGARNFKDDLRDDLGELILVNDRKISRQRAFIKVLVDHALAGDMRAATILSSLCTRIFGTDADGPTEAPLPPDDRAILEKFLARELDRRRGEAEPAAETAAAESTGAHDADES